MEGKQRPALFVRGARSSHVGEVALVAEQFDELFLVVVNVALHDLHARPQQALEGLHVKDCEDSHC